MRLLLLADQWVGSEITKWLLQNYPEDLALVVAKSDGLASAAARDAKVPVAIFESDVQLLTELAKVEPIDLGVLAWWPSVISDALMHVPRAGFINTHPSLLPFNRGKHYNFWAIVEQAPFGVTLHMVTSALDAGDIVAQRAIPYGWEDTGQSLYEKASTAMVRLFQDTYPMLRGLEFPRRPQPDGGTEPHRSAELDPASHLELDRSYTARELLNLLRARTFPPHPAAWFTDEGATYEVRVVITHRDP